MVTLLPTPGCSRVGCSGIGVSVGTSAGAVLVGAATVTTMVPSCVGPIGTGASVAPTATAVVAGGTPGGGGAAAPVTTQDPSSTEFSVFFTACLGAASLMPAAG